MSVVNENSGGYQGYIYGGTFSGAVDNYGTIDMTGVTAGPPNFLSATVTRRSSDAIICSAGSSWNVNKCVEAVACGNGAVTGIETCDDGNTTAGDGCSATCQIESGWVCSTPGSPCMVVEVSLNQHSVSLAVKHSQQLVVTVTPPDAVDKSVTWSSSNPAVATVDNTGTVTGVSPGDATIVTTLTTNGSLKDTANVTVTPNGVVNPTSGGGIPTPPPAPLSLSLIHI